MKSLETLCGLIQANLLNHNEGQVPLTILPDTALLEEGWLDSLTIMAIVTAVEREFEITFPEHKILAASFRTPTSLWAVIEQSMSALPSA